MEIRQLRYFQMVAHTGGIGSAARQLGITQPALTAALRKLEASVGATLLVRDHRGAHLTASGRELLAVASDTLRTLAEARQRIVDVEREPAGRIQLASPGALAQYLLPELIAKLTSTYARLELVLATAPSTAVEEGVIARDHDLGLVTHPPSHPDLVAVDLFRDRVELVVRAEVAAATWAEATETLARLPLYFTPHVPQAREIVEMLERRAMATGRRVHVGDIGVVKELVLVGAGVAILPRRVAEHRTNGALRVLHDGLPSVPDVIRLINRVDLHKRRAANLVRTSLLEHGRALA
jgi:DNA-binding transcriptional LysR family regulator